MKHPFYPLSYLVFHEGNLSSQVSHKISPIYTYIDLHVGEYYELSIMFVEIEFFY